MNSPIDIAAELRAISSKLQELHGRILYVEQRHNFAPGGSSLLDLLANDPGWAWLRALSLLIADIDHAVANDTPLGETDRSAVAAHVRGLLFGEGDLQNDDFLFRYRQLLQLDAEVASIHGELRAMLRGFPSESENESERLHARHLWTQRVKHYVERRLKH